MPEKIANSKINIDDYSKAIIRELQRDGRQAYGNIGKIVGLSEAAVRHRIQKLVDSQIIQIVAVTNPLEIGFSRQAMIGIKVAGPVEAVANQLAEVPEIDYVVLTAGSFDILIEVVCESDENLLDLISNKVRAIPNVIGTETFMYLKLAKQTYTWGVK